MSAVRGIKAIPTRYKGYHFRSRLEARWAVFFDALGLEWEYEPQGYVLPTGDCYLPDFVLASPTRRKVYVEVKPNGPLGEGLVKTNAFRESVTGDGAQVLVVKGPPGTTTCRWNPWLEEWGGLVDEVDFEYFWCGLLFRDGVTEAVAAARSARFEHGECGAT